MSNHQVLQTEIKKLRIQLHQRTHICTPCRWQQALKKLTELCCVNARNFSHQAAMDIPKHLQRYYYERATTWLKYAYQANDAMLLLDSYTALPKADQQFAIAQLRNSDHLSDLAHALESGSLISQED